MSASDDPQSASEEEFADTGSDATRVAKLLMVAAILTAVLLITEVIGGVASGSLSLLADACYMLADLIALLVARFSILRNANKDPEWNPTTSSRLTHRVGYAIGAMLCLLGIAVGIEAIRRLLADEVLILPKLMFWVAIGGLIVNLICWKILGSADTQDDNLFEARRHTLNDTLGSIAVAAAAIAIVAGTTWLVRVDAILSVCFAVLMLINGSLAIRESSRESGTQPPIESQNVTAKN